MQAPRSPQSAQPSRRSAGLDDPEVFDDEEPSEEEPLPPPTDDVEPELLMGQAQPVSEDLEAPSVELVSRSAAKTLARQHKALVKSAKFKKLETQRSGWASELSHCSAATLPICHAPSWAQQIHPSHRVFYRGGIFVCSRCGCYAARKPQRLTKNCDPQGFLEPAIAIIKKATPPRGVAEWPQVSKSTSTPPLFVLRWPERRPGATPEAMSL